MSAFNISTRLTLNDGLKIPIFGLGVYLSKGNKGVQAVSEALKVGYEHIDTAQLYANENEVGKAVNDSGLPREKIWVTSKIWDSEHGYDSASKSIKSSLSAANLSYFDLMLIHSPNPGKKLRLETYKALISAKSQGLVRSIGVSNYGVKHLRELEENFPNDPPSVNQIELSPFFQRREIVEECKKRDIKIEAYSPLGKGAHTDLPELHEIAKPLCKTPAQILIRWSLQSGFICIPKSSNPDRIKANSDIFDFALFEEEMKLMDSLETGAGVTWDVSFGVKLQKTMDEACSADIFFPFPLRRILQRKSADNCSLRGLKTLSL